MDPDEGGSKDSGESTFENEIIQNELNSTFNQMTARQHVQSPYSNGILGGQDDQQQFLIYSKQNELRLNDKLRKPPATFNQAPIQVHPNQFSADLPTLNKTDRLIDDLLTADQQKRSHSQPVFTTAERRSTSHHFVQSENGLDINQYALVQNSSGSSVMDYSVDDQTKTQSIVTNVYLNCNHGRRLANPVRKRKMKLIKTYSSQRNLNYDLANLEERTQLEERNQMNQYSSLGDLLKGNDELKDEDGNRVTDLIANDEKKGFGNDLLGELLDGGGDDEDRHDDLSNTSGSLTELKNLKLSSEQRKDKRTKLNQLREDSRKASHDLKAGKKFDGSKAAEHEDKKSPNDDSSNKTDSRCSHYLHYKPEVHTTKKYSNDFSHVKPKVDTRNNISYLKAQSNLLRSKSNLEDLALEELDEAGEIMQNAEKSLRKYVNDLPHLIHHLN